MAIFSMETRCIMIHCFQHSVTLYLTQHLTLHLDILLPLVRSLFKVLNLVFKVNPKPQRKLKELRIFPLKKTSFLFLRIGNDQKGAAYWKRIWEYFYNEKVFELECNQGSLMHRWSGIQLDVNKFCCIYAEIERTRASGKIEQDRIMEAKQKFRSDRGYNFAYEHCWPLLKFHHKMELGTL